DVVAIDRQPRQQLSVLGVALHQSIARIAVEGPSDRAVLAEVVDSDHLVTRTQQLGDEVAADESCGAGHENLQGRIGPVIPQMSTTSRPSSSSPRYARCGAPTTMTSESRSTVSRASKLGSGT